MIATVVVSYKRPELLDRTLTSYLATVSLPYRLLVVDNGGSEANLEIAAEYDAETVRLSTNRFPGYATNAGWDRLVSDEPLFLHRSDGDVEYLPGWCDEVSARFYVSPELGQLGLRTRQEEGNHPNVGGNCVVRREVFEKVRWQDSPWQRGTRTEDYHFSVAVAAAGFKWDRVQQPCIVHLGTGTPKTDAYYAETWHNKGYGGY